MENQNYSLQIENIHQLKLDNICVNLEYSNNKSLEECIINILKQKIKDC